MNYRIVFLMTALSFAWRCHGQSQDEFIFNMRDLTKKVLESSYEKQQEVDGQAEAVVTVDFDLRDPLVSQRFVFNGFSPRKLAAKLGGLRNLIKRAKTVKAEISYLFADVKYDGTALKILELGEGKNGGFRSFDAVFEEGRIWKGFWNYITTLGLPVFYMGPAPTDDPINKIGISLNEKIAWSTFMEKSGLWSSSMEELKKRADFQALGKDAPSGDGSRLADYKAILIYKFRDDRDPDCLIELEQFKQEYPNVLVLDCASRPFAASKHLNDILFRSGSDTAQYRPVCGLYSKKLHNGLSEKIISDLGGEFFVIKPVDSGMSNGIIVTSRELLGVELRRILAQNSTIGDLHPYTFNHRPTETQSYEYWKGDTNRNFLVEAYAPSRTIEVLGKQYDPTIRVVFGLVHDGDNIRVKFFEHWWKLPPKALDEYAVLTLKHVSQYRPDLKELPAAQLTLSDEDERGVRTMMADAMAHAYVKMLILNNERKVEFAGSSKQE